MRNQITQVHNISSEDLKNEIVTNLVTELRKELQLMADNLKPKTNPEFITSKDACKILGVTLPTIASWRKSGIIIAYRIGNKVRFKKSEIENSLKQII